MKDIFIAPNATTVEALKKLDKSAEKTLVVVDKDKKLLGTLTDGDVRRFILKTGKIEGALKGIYNSDAVTIHTDGFSKERVKDIMLKNKIELLPVIDNNGKVVEYITWVELFGKPKKNLLEKDKIDIPAVIMAGGRGTRLDPFTKVLPKPLIPVGDKTIIEHIIDSFKKSGVKKFYITVNYKGEMIEAYFKGIKKDYQVDFIWEKEFLGTAGSLKLLENKIDGNFIVSNCDILLNNIDYTDVYKFHLKENSMFTSLTSIQHYKIPYGIVNMKNGGFIESITEKPEYMFQINTGVYILNSKILNNIPDNNYFDMPELISKIIENKDKILAYPLNEGDYVDLGQWEEYKKALEKLKI